MSIVSWKYILNNNEVFRFDSNYFLKEFLNDEKLIRNNKFDKLKNLCSEIKSFGAYSLNNEVEYIEKGIPFIRGVNMKNGNINFEDIINISEKANKLLWKSEIRPEMVLLSMSGTIGDVAIASKNWKYPINSSQDLAKIDTDWLINPYFLYCFLMTKFGQNYFKREARGSVQQHVFLSQIELLEIPILDYNFILKIENIVKDAHSKLEQSKTLYTEAENLLLAELGLNDWQPTKLSSNSVSFSNSFLQTGRLDAEYYQPKYDELYNYLKRKETKTLGSIAKIKKSIEPGSNAYQETGIPFVRVSNITKYGLSEPEIHLNRAEYETSDLKPKKDTILLTKDGTVGTAYKVEKDLDIITSGAILHLITLILNSIVVSTQAERDAGGSIIQHWKPSEIEQVIIPKLPITIQQVISTKVQQSFVLRTESKKLLELAKQAVEIAIEKGEEEGMKLLNSI